MRVLIVDDHPVYRKGLRALLETKDSSLEVVGEAANGLEALSLVATTTPDAVVMDISMPQLNGLEATRQLQEQFPLVKVIILSSYSDKAYVTQAIKYGAQGFVLKDAVFEELVVALNAVKNNRRYITPGVLEPILTHYIDSPPVSKEMVAYNNLTTRERQVFKLLARGLTRNQIAQKLRLSPKTTDAHRNKLLQKLNLKNETDIKTFVEKMQQEQSTTTKLP